LSQTVSEKPTNQVTNPPDVAGLRVLVVGLGRFGGGVGVTRWLISQGASVTVTDLASRDQLADSIAQIADLDVNWRLGGHDPADLDAIDLAVVNPAVNKVESEFFQTLVRRRIPYTTEMNLFCERCPAPIIGVTGSYGKSTTCEMLAAALRACRRSRSVDYTGVHLGGNIGRSLLTDLSDILPSDQVILEMSNAQLEDLPMIHWAPRIAVITNLSPHHLNRYDSYEAYLTAKLNIIGTPHRTSTVVIGDIDSPAEDVLCRVVPDHEARVTRIVEPHPPVELCIPGAHNRANAACVLTVCQQLGLDEGVVREALQSFAGLPHRLEFVRTIDGVDYYNDSKSTSPAATVKAVESFDRPIVAIVGGQNIETSKRRNVETSKHQNVETSKRRNVKTSSLRDPGAPGSTPGHFDFSTFGLLDFSSVHTLTRASRAVICTGQSGPIFAAALREETQGKSTCRICEAEDLEDALNLAHSYTQPGDVVLFSPGAPSFDRYANFAARGRHFVDLVNAL
jgi:UDP-N-acetylmuramoylalanine--D-glutamate ligase